LVEVTVEHEGDVRHAPNLRPGCDSQGVEGGEESVAWSSGKPRG
jgi:hypothetical protein